MKFFKKKSETSQRLSKAVAVASSRLTLPAAILVAGATNEDNTERVAVELAGQFLEAAYRVGYVALGTSRKKMQVPETVMMLNSSGFSQNPSAGDFEARMQKWRASVDVVIIDAPSFQADPMALRFGPFVDGVIVALRAGRAVRPEDGELAEVLRSLRAVLLGVVTTQQQKQLRAPKDGPAIVTITADPRSALSRV
jgi:hypothetical protein